MTKFLIDAITESCNFIVFVPTPTLVGREELYTQMGSFLFSQFWPIYKVIVESCEWYH